MADALRIKADLTAFTNTHPELPTVLDGPNVVDMVEERFVAMVHTAHGAGMVKMSLIDSDLDVVIASTQSPIKKDGGQLILNITHAATSSIVPSPNNNNIQVNVAPADYGNLLFKCEVMGTVEWSMLDASLSGFGLFNSAYLAEITTKGKHVFSIPLEFVTV